MILKPPKGAMLNRGHPLARGLVGCWLMNEGGGNIVNDLSGNGNRGVFGTGLNSPSWVAGKFGNAIATGATKYITAFPLKGPWNVNQFTVVAHAKLMIDPTTFVCVLVSIVTTGGTDEILRLVSTTPTGTWFVSNDFGLSLTGPVVVTNQWYQIAIVFDYPRNATLYVDGVKQVSDITLAGSVGSPNLFSISGYAWAQSAGWQGEVSDVKVYNRALTATEVQQLYMTPFRMFEREPIELWTATMGGGAAPSNMIYDYRVRVG